MSLHCLPHITLETAANPSASIIWLHGLGANGHDFEAIVPELNLPDKLAVRFIFPHAPAMPVSINGGYIMPAWYDIKQQDLHIEHDAQGVYQSQSAIQMLIDQEIMRGIAPENIILAGFSQGAAMSLYVGLRQSTPLAGIMALSGYVLLPDELKNIASQATQTAVFMAHGIHDPVVKFDLGEASYRQLQSINCHIDWHTYPIEHTLCPEEIKHISEWIVQRLQHKA